MKCPECGHDTKVTNSRYMKHHVWRRRECLYAKCKHRHTTKEYEAKYVDKLIRFYKANSRSNDDRKQKA